MVELFDHWDHTAQTGNDTEYAIVVLALCIGALYSFSRRVFKSLLIASASGFAAELSSPTLFAYFSRNCLAMIASSPSPPVLALRI